MKTVEYDEGGREVVEITRVEKKKLPDSEFLPPEGYKKVDLADMGKMMG